MTNNDGSCHRAMGCWRAASPVSELYLLLDNWGTMTFEQVLQPAIQLADEGFR
jgi:gamma-glutamyltranspeptidase